jgi:mRNA interferase HicA
LKESEFLRKLKKLGRSRGVAVAFDPEHGDGSHGRVYYGAAFTTLKDRKKELGHGLLHQMCGELGIGERDLDGR